MPYYGLIKPCFLFCRCGAQFGLLKALTRALSLTPTVRHASGSLAPSPIPTSSQSTLAARQTHPWIPSRSVSCGDRDWTWSEQGGEATAVIAQNMPNVHLRLPNLDCQKAGGLIVDYMFSSRNYLPLNEE